VARSLIVLPDDSAKPILTAIEGATRTLRVKMFVFSDPSLLKAVVDAKRRKVKVRVMLNPARRSGEQDNEATRKALERVGVEVMDANPAFALTHEKSMVVDEETAFIKSLNWTTRNLSETRDYAVVTKRRHEVAEIGGSINFAAGSLDARRELAIESRNDEVVDRLHKVARHDWKHSHPLDLSDEGLLADLEDRVENSAQLLALDPENGHSGS